MSYTRFALYSLPEPGPLSTFGARWLGWDVLKGMPVSPLPIPGLELVTASARKYGFHGTLKPPVRLAEGATPDALARAVAKLAADCAPARAQGLRVTRLGQFLALVPEGPQDDIARVARACVTELDAFRAPAPQSELDRRRKAGLSAQQEALLQRWGYPYVLDEFRFHLTLTGPLEDPAPWEKVLEDQLPILPAPFRLDDIALVGERSDGRFELIDRYALTG